MAESGYTLPVWVAAAARAALDQLLGVPFRAEQPLQLDPEAPALAPEAIRVVAAAPLGEGRALAVARCEPGDGLDLTRGLVVWVEVAWRPLLSADPQGWLQVEAGEGVGVHAATRAPCLSAFARALLDRNLGPAMPPGRGLQVRVIFPQGRRLAERTSNAAFGVVEGLALIGTQARVQRSADPDQLGGALTQLRQRAAAPGFAGDLVLVIGENGLDSAPRLGIPAELVLKVGNWIGPVLVAADAVGVRRLLLFGYQGKLLKLAAGIFHTHHHLADGRAEVLTALAALEGLSGAPLRALHGAATVEDAFLGLEQVDQDLAQRLRRRLAARIEERSRLYLQRHGGAAMVVGAALFDRARRLRALGPRGEELLCSLAQAAVLESGGAGWPEAEGGAT